MFEPDVLTPYDEFPVHATPYPFSHVPSTDYNWDDGYYFGALNPDERAFLVAGFRVNPNTDMVGGFVVLNVDGIQRTFRFSRCWRRDYSLRIGPFYLDFVVPLRKMHLVLGDNESGISFDMMWEGCSPAFLEEHHSAKTRGRFTTDQSRYVQPGVIDGTLRLGKRVWDLGRPGWFGVRDHSWGLYFERPPFGPSRKWLPPKPPNPDARALRIWVVFKTGELSGFYHLHEDADGVQRQLNDVFGSPFAGRFHRGWDTEVIEMAGATHKVEFQPGTRIVTRATITLRDVKGGVWTQKMDVAAPPWVVQTTGYTPGGWTDGGSVHSYHGSEVLATEWDEFDFSKQPSSYTPYGAPGDAGQDPTGARYQGEKIQGVEYAVRIKTIAPCGTVYEGQAQLEVYSNGPYKPYGFK